MRKYSIVLPVRNGWPYVQECVESILAQSFPDFDLVVLDNQSTDGTVEWLKTKSDDRIRLYGSRTALSIVESWGRIKDVVKHEYMTIIGHDDVLDPDFLATIDSLVERHPDSALYLTGSRFINAKGNKIRTCKPVPALETAAQYLEARFKYERDISASGYVMRSADYDRIGGIPRFEKLYFSDDALWLSLMSGSNKVTEPSEHLSIRIHEKSESASVPSLWPLILLGLNQFGEFLRNFDDPESRTVCAAHMGQFMAAYHRNIYIYALIEACKMNRKIDRAVTEKIQNSLAKNAPSMAGRLRRSAKVAAIEALNAGPTRVLVPYLWDVYYGLKTRSQ